MKLPERATLSESKYEAILALLAQSGVDLNDIEESFVRGSGHGGQKINKTSSAVQLKHVPTGTLVKFQEHRERSMNRVLALRELLRKLTGETAKDAIAEKIRKQKKRRKRRGAV